MSVVGISRTVVVEIDTNSTKVSPQRHALRIHLYLFSNFKINTIKFDLVRPAIVVL